MTSLSLIKYLSVSLLVAFAQMKSGASLRSNDESQAIPAISGLNESASQVEVKSTRAQMELNELTSVMPTREELADIQTLMLNYDDFQGQKSVADIGFLALKAKHFGLPYSDLVVHRYDNFEDLRRSTGAGVDNELCLSQLQELIARAQIQSEHERFQSMDINLYRLLDTYGRVPAGLLIGDGTWLGEHDQCLRLKIQLNGTESAPVNTRYCIGSLKHKIWKTESVFDENLVLKTGVCLPHTCDSTNYKNKYELIKQLAEFNSRQVDQDQVEVVRLYCLPDEQSPLRSIWQSPTAAAAMSLLIVWLTIIIYSTVKYELILSGAKPASGSSLGVGLTRGFDLKRVGKNETRKDQQQANNQYFKLYRSLSIVNNLRLLFDTTKTSALMEVGKGMEQANERPGEEQVTEKESQREKGNLSQPAPARSLVDLSSIEGIKVICMMYVVLGHVLMIMTQMVRNAIEVANLYSPIYFTANLMPAFAVNSFFTITGILTSYLLFKQNQTHSFITSPLKWAAFFVYRYLRIMPMYVLVVAYAKYLSKYAGSGPNWDYATSAVSPRNICEQESWLWTLLYGANFKSPLEHCVPSAWYLANDFQFFLVTPIFLVALYKWPRFGQRLLIGGIIAGYLAGFLSIFFSGAPDLRPVANFMPHGFKTYINFLHSNYTRPMYRCPAYFIGLLLGFKLYSLEQAKLAYFQEVKSREENYNNNNNNNTELDQDKDKLEEPDWSDYFKRNGSRWSIVFVTICCLSPIIAARLPLNRPMAKLLLSFFMPSFHLLFALSIGFYILLATTGHANKQLNRFLSSPAWKPFSRLSLCVVLINCEVINFLVQNNPRMQNLDNQHQFGLSITSLLASYLFALISCVLFEAPIRAALNHLLTVAMSRFVSKRKAE